MYVRDQLRQAIFQAISTNAGVLAVVGVDNIHLERFEAFQTKDIHSNKAAQFPAINIIVNDDSSAQVVGKCSKFEVEQTVEVECYVNAVDSYGSKIDEIVAAVNAALYAVPSLGLKIRGGPRFDGSRMAKDLSESLYAGRVLNYTYFYTVDLSDPEILI
jgi:hypothetical protein